MIYSDFPTLQYFLFIILYIGNLYLVEEDYYPPLSST